MRFPWLCVDGRTFDVGFGNFGVQEIDRADKFVDAKISYRALLYTCLS